MKPLRKNFGFVERRREEQREEKAKVRSGGLLDLIVFGMALLKEGRPLPEGASQWRFELGDARFARPGDRSRMAVTPDGKAGVGTFAFDPEQLADIDAFAATHGLTRRGTLEKAASLGFAYRDERLSWHRSVQASALAAVATSRN